MQYSAEHKARSHEKILSMAARSFRERGGDSSGIGTVIRKVGLKKGGFYRHFRSKDDLFVEAVARALDDTGRGMSRDGALSPSSFRIPWKDPSGGDEEPQRCPPNHQLTPN